MQKTIEKIKFLNNRKQIGSLCCAPFTSMYFGHRGIISACCTNRTKILGVYPEKSLEEIWNGIEYKKMREDLKSFKFSLGCDQCKRLLKTGNLSTLKIPQHDVPGNKFEELKYPYKLNFELDNKCNLMCIMCHGKYSSKILKYRENKPAYASPYLNEVFFNELQPFLKNAGSLEFYGGEPFLIDIYLKILDYVHIHNPGVNIYIQSNGTIVSEKILNLVDKLQINLSISMDSVIKSTYEKIRVGANYDKVVKNIESFHDILKSNGRKFYISPILCNLNYNELIDFYNFANKYEMELYFHDLTTPREMSVYVLKEHQLQEQIEIIESKMSKISLPSTEIEKYNFNVINSQLTHLKYILNNIVTAYKKDNFSIKDFLLKYFPKLEKTYVDAIASYNISDKILSNSIIFSSMNEPPENNLYKQFSKLSEPEAKELIITFIQKEKEIINRLNI